MVPALVLECKVASAMLSRSSCPMVTMGNSCCAGEGEQAGTAPPQRGASWWCYICLSLPACVPHQQDRKCHPKDCGRMMKQHDGKPPLALQHLNGVPSHEPPHMRLTCIRLDVSEGTNRVLSISCKGLKLAAPTNQTHLGSRREV